MALTSVTPASGSIINNGDIVTAVTDDAGGVVSIVHIRSGSGATSEVVFTDAGGYQAGFTGSYVESGDATAVFRRDAGWDSSPFRLDVTTASNTYSVNYTLAAEGQYPPDMQPFNDPVPDTGSADIAIQEDGVHQGTAGTINVAYGLNALVANGVANIYTDPGESGSGDVTSSESQGTVADNELAVFDGTTGKLIKAATGVLASGGGLSADVITGLSLLATSGYITVIGTGAKVWVSEYTIGSSPTALPGTGVFWVRPETGSANTPMFTDGEGTDIDLSQSSGGGYSALTDINSDISPDHIANVHIQSSVPAVAVDGDIWIEIS